MLYTMNIQTLNNRLKLFGLSFTFLRNNYIVVEEFAASVGYVTVSVGYVTVSVGYVTASVGYVTVSVGYVTVEIAVIPCGA